MKSHRSLFTLIFLGFAATITLAADAGPSKFRPGELWPDDKGVPINAHGGGVIAHDGFYYWFGERPKNPIDGRYVWLPEEWENDHPVLRWHAEWDLSVFARR